MFNFLRRILRRSKRPQADQLLKTGGPRKIRIHSKAPVDPEMGDESPVRVAFEFLDPPGPWSLQFFIAEPGQTDVLEHVNPDTTAWYYESEDGARTRVMKFDEDRILYPY